MSTAMTVAETCAECGFDGAAYTHDDVLGTLRTIAPWWRLLTDGVGDATLQARPTTSTWSAVEYGAHTAEVLRLLSFALQWMLDDDEPQFPSIEPPPVAAEPATDAPADVTAQLADAATTMQQVVRGVTDAARHRRANLGDGTTVDAGWLARHAIHDALHHLHDVGRNLVALGVGPAHSSGTVAQISASGGGVPKLAVASCTVGPRGVVGDRQRERRHHGRAWQALCLFAAEAVDRLQAEGHPIAFGNAGENFTIRGLQWESLRPGLRLQIGDVCCELSVPALPCVHNARWFLDGDFMRMHHEHHRADTRWYASVVAGGTVHTGDPVVVVP